jgi:mono/diheme cytochrome c family protein
VACSATLAENKAALTPLGTPTPTSPPLPTIDPAEVALGQQVYVQHCAACHGPKGEGQPNWKVLDASGNSPHRHTMTPATPGITPMGCSMKSSVTASVTRSSRQIVH